MSKRLLILIVIVFSLNLNAQNKKNFTLDECLNLAEKNNYEIIISKEQEKAGKYEMRSAFGQYLPSISYNMGYSRRLNIDGGSTVNVGGQIIRLQPQDPNSFNMAASASVFIFDGFGREGNFRRADNNYEASKLMTRQTKQDILIRVYSSYINVIRNYQINSIRKKNLELSNNDLERIKAQYEAGVLPIAVVYSQEAEIANSEVELIGSENDLHSSKAELMKLMGLMPDINANFSIESLPREINQTDINNFRRLVGSLEYAIERALKNRADFKASEFYVDAAEGSLQAAKSQYLPTISAAGGWNWSNTELSEFKDNARSYIGLNLNVPIFQNFRVDRDVQQSRLNLTQQKMALNSAEQIVREEVQRSYLNLESAEKSIDASKRAVRASQQNYNSTQERFNVGSANITDLQAANTQFVTAEINYINAVYNYIAAQKQILYAVGEIK